MVVRRLTGVPELMDRPDVDPASLLHTLTDLARINRLFGATQLVVHTLADWLPTPGPWKLLDVGTGCLPIPRAIVDWARQRRIALTIHAIEKHPTTCDLAARACRGYPEIHIYNADALALPFSAGSFDVAFASQVLHHCEGPDTTGVLGEMSRVASRLLVSDLRRGMIPFVATWSALHLVSNSPLIRHDGPLSIRRGFVPAELNTLGHQAGWDNVQVRRHRFFRLALVGTGGRRWTATPS